MAFAEAGASLPLIRDGKLRALAVTSSTRLPTVPELPPFGEAVGAPDFEAVSWHVLLAPAGTPKEVVDKLHGEMKRIMAAPGHAQKIAASGSSRSTSPRSMTCAAYIQAEGEKWGALVASSGWRARSNARVDASRLRAKSPPFRPIARRIRTPWPNRNRRKPSDLPRGSISSRPSIEDAAAFAGALAGARRGRCRGGAAAAQARRRARR